MNPARFVILPLFLAGCTTARIERTVSAPTNALPPDPVPAVAPVTQVAFTPYAIGPYRDANDPTLVHDAHTLYRRTVVPMTFDSWLATVPRSSFAPASFTALPPSTELAAVLATQRTVTAELQTLRNTMAETGQKMQEQYRVLVRESTKAKVLREQLEAERSAAAPAAGGQPTDNQN